MGASGMRWLSRFVALAVALTISAPAWAQQPSLADVAKEEANRRKNLKARSRVYTNDDVKGGAPVTTSTAAPAPPATQPTAAPAAPDVKSAKPAPPAEETRDEAWWRKRASELRDQLNRNRLFAEALQSRINALWADFTARDDPAQRAIIERNRNEALVELDRVKSDITRQEQAVADFEEEARKAGVPPGWLR